MPIPVEILPDTELAYISYLRAGIAGRSEAVLSGLVLGRFVDPSKAVRFVAVRRIGGSSDTHGWDVARFAVQVWAASAEDRMGIAQILRALSKAANTHSSAALLYRAETLGPSALPDPADATKQVVQFTHELWCRSLPA